MLREYRIGFGTTFDREQNMIAPVHRDAALLRADDSAARAFGGFSRWYCAGGWISPRHGLVQEHGVQYSIVADEADANKVRVWANGVGRELNQESLVFIGPAGADIVDVYYPGE